MNLPSWGQVFNLSERHGQVENLSPRPPGRWLAILISSLGLFVGPMAAQTIPYGGSEVFRFALHQKKLKPAAGAEAVLRDPTRSVIIALGDTDGLNRLISGTQLRSFLINGGAILIASDQSNADPAFQGWTWGEVFEITISGHHLSNKPARCYKGLPGRPFVEPVWVRELDPQLIKLFGRLPLPVATDHPSEMTFGGGLPGLSVTELAKYPPGTTRDRDAQPPGPGLNTFAVAIKPVPGRNPVAGGRMLVVADHSAFVNGMLGFVKDDTKPERYAFDNGNWEFANRTIDWLQRGPGPARTTCLFVEDGVPVPQFAVTLPPGGPPPGLPDIPPEVIANWLLNAADPILNEYQEKDAFNKFFDRRPDFAAKVVRYLVIGLTLAFAFIALRRMVRGYRKPESTPLPTAVAAGMLPRRGVVRQRTDAQLEVGNLYEAARRRVRDRFDRLGGAPGRRGDMPPVLVATDCHDGDLLRSAVGWLWPIGYGEVPVPVPPPEWDRVNALLERLTRRAATGDWSFGVEVA